MKIQNRYQLWERYRKYLFHSADLGLSIDISRMNFPDDLFSRMEPDMQRSFSAMDRLESGSIANPDENRMVGHYWLRNPSLAPSPEIKQDIEDAIGSISRFVRSVHSGAIRPQRGSRFRNYLSIGIGGSALGPQFVTDALGTSSDTMRSFFLDNTDPDGIDRTFHQIGGGLSETLVIVISKSGGTIETRNGMIEAMKFYEKADLRFGDHAIAITGVGSNLYNLAKSERWIGIFPMWDWVGGRTSITSSVGLLPMALQGIDIKSFLDGCAFCDSLTRQKTTISNPAAILSLMWYHATGGKGSKDMVILPYKDRLQMFTRFLQQLIMESLGKERDLSGKAVHQGISVYGNKGATDQHAYVQQLRDGLDNFFVTFIEVLRDRGSLSPRVKDDVTSGDYLNAFFQGTRDALHERGRESLTITIDQLNARSLGALIALYERAVGLYADLVNINAYHQPGVESGKKAAASVISLQQQCLAFLRSKAGQDFSSEDIATALSIPDRSEAVYKILDHAAANPDHRIKRLLGKKAFESRYLFEV